jgi:hypothetical protein
MDGQPYVPCALRDAKRSHEKAPEHCTGVLGQGQRAVTNLAVPQRALLNEAVVMLDAIEEEACA